MEEFVNSASNDLVQVNGNNQSPTGYDSARSSFGTKSAFLALDYSSNSGGNNVSWSKAGSFNKNGMWEDWVMKQGTIPILTILNKNTNKYKYRFCYF